VLGSSLVTFGGVTPDEIDELRAQWKGVAFWNHFETPHQELTVWIGADVVADDKSLTLIFRADGDAELFGVRFANDALPGIGIMFDDDMIRTPRDWYLDRRIALGEALDTGLLERAQRQPCPGWTELVVDSEEWG
jgi:hypothetical protein